MRIEEIIADEVALIVPSFVITVVAYLVSRRIGSDAEMRFLGDLAAGNLIAEPVAPADWMRIAELVDRYRDLPLGTVDASVIAAAERLQITEIATLDRRHFNVVRSQPGPLTLLPDAIHEAHVSPLPVHHDQRAIGTSASAHPLENADALFLGHQLPLPPQNGDARRQA